MRDTPAAQAATEVGSSIPISLFPPVTVQRPLRLFGRSFQVYISSALTFSPATVLEAAVGLSWLQLLRQDKRRPDIALRDLWRGITRKNRLSKTTCEKVRRIAGWFFPPETLQPLLIGEMPVHVPPMGSDWEILHQTIGPPGEDAVYRLVERCAQFDATARVARNHLAHQRTEEAAHLLRGLDFREGWARFGYKVDVRVVLLIEVSLHIWAHVECRRERHGVVAKTRTSDLLALLQHGRKPIGHWIQDMQKIAGRKTLLESLVLFVLVPPSLIRIVVRVQLVGVVVQAVPVSVVVGIHAVAAVIVGRSAHLYSPLRFVFAVVQLNTTATRLRSTRIAADWTA